MLTATHYLMSFIRKIRNRGQTPYAKAENRKMKGKVVQRYIRYIGKHPDATRNFSLDTVQFGYAARRLIQSDLTANELTDMLEGMGHGVPREDMEAIGICCSFKKKNITLSLYHARKSGGRKCAKDSGKELVAEKTYRRKIIALSGCNEIVFTPKMCPDHRSRSNRRALNAIVPED